MSIILRLEKKKVWTLFGCPLKNEAKSKNLSPFNCNNAVLYCFSSYFSNCSYSSPLAAFSSSSYLSTMKLHLKVQPLVFCSIFCHLSGLILTWKISTFRSWAHTLTWDPTLQLQQLHQHFPLGCPWSSHALSHYLPLWSSSHSLTKYLLPLDATPSFQAFSLKILEMLVPS